MPGDLRFYLIGTLVESHAASAWTIEHVRFCSETVFWALGRAQLFTQPIRPARRPFMHTWLPPQALFASKQYKRASVLLKCELGLVPGSGAVSGTSKSGPVSMEFRHLAARCLLECKEYDEVLTLLGDEEAEEEALAMSEEVRKHGTSILTKDVAPFPQHGASNGILPTLNSSTKYAYSEHTWLYLGDPTGWRMLFSHHKPPLRP